MVCDSNVNIIEFLLYYVGPVSATAFYGAAAARPHPRVHPG